MFVFEVYAPKVANGPASAQLRKAPMSMAALLPYADNIVDVVSSKEDKAIRAKYFLKDLQGKKAKAEKELNDEKNKPQGEKVPELEMAVGFYTALLAHIANLTNSFQSMQSRWHMQVNEISDYASEKIKAGNIFIWAKKWMPWLAGPVVAVGTELTGGWKEIVGIVKGYFPATAQGIGEMTAYLGGILLMVGISWGVNKLAVVAEHRTKVKRDQKLDEILKEEGTVRLAIRAIVQQIALGIAAEFKYDEELRRAGDADLQEHSKNDEIQGIWKTVNKRINKIREKLPEIVRDLFPASLDVPDYIDMRNSNGKQPQTSPPTAQS